MGSYFLPALAGAWPAMREPLGIADRTSSGRGYAITFDDGPHAQGTPAVLEILATAGVSATFFLVGEQVQRNPGLAREIVAAGHAVGLHCHRHRNLLRLAPWQVREDIATAQALIEQETERPIELYRPPYGVINASALRIARSQAGGRFCGRSGAGTGAGTPRRSRSPRASRTVSAKARCCCCTTPTTTPRPARGGAPQRRCRVCCRCSQNAACSLCRLTAPLRPLGRRIT